MQTITVEKQRLLDTLTTNRARHAEQFQLAIVKYRDQAIARFTEFIEQIKAGKDVPRVLPLPIPEEHTEDYDRVIAMIDWHDESWFELTESEFRQYVQDEWGWARTFAANTSSYNG